MKTIRLIGRQNLQIYKDQCWKGDANDIAREYERNKAIGLKLGQWKQGVLVYDDDGLVRGGLLGAVKGVLSENLDADRESDFRSSRRFSRQKRPRMTKRRRMTKKRQTAMPTKTWIWT